MELPPALQVGQFVERHIVGESDPAMDMSAQSQGLLDSRLSPRWRPSGAKADEEATALAADAAYAAPSHPPQFDPDPNANWDFDFSGDGRPFRFACGKVSRVSRGGKDSLRQARLQLRGQEAMEVADRDSSGILRHVGPVSLFGGLGECGDLSCCAHRLFNPKVRAHFRDFVLDWLHRAFA